MGERRVLGKLAGWPKGRWRFSDEGAPASGHYEARFSIFEFWRILGAKNVFLVQKRAKIGQKCRFFARNFQTPLPICL